MNMQRLVLGLMVIGSVATFSMSVSAAAKKKAFELYSWQQEGTVNYCYAVLPASKEARTAEQIKASPDKVCGGSGDLKRIMGQAIPLESKVTWKTDSANGFILPTRDIVNDLGRFAKTMPYTLVVPEAK